MALSGCAASLLMPSWRSVTAFCHGFQVYCSGVVAEFARRCSTSTPKREVEIVFFGYPCVMDEGWNAVATLLLTVQHLGLWLVPSARVL